METNNLDVLVIGAGTAGLAAARALHSQGLKVAVLEAQNRIGGRILTVHDPLAGYPIELGAEFVHGRSPALWDTLRSCHSPVVEAQGEHWVADETGLHESQLFDETAPVFEAMSRAPEQSFDSFLRNTDFTDRAKLAATGFVEGFNAARKERVSVAWLNFENAKAEEIEGDRNFRVMSGYDAVPLHLSAGLDIRLSTPVSRVRWQPGKVLAETPFGEFHARCAVIAVPFGVLQRGSLVIDPEPASLTAARTAIETGHVFRFVFRFAKVPWEQPRLSFLHGDQPFPVWWTPYPVVAPIITGWAAGPKADDLLDLGLADVEQIALESLRGILGSGVPAPERTYVHDWNRDPFSRGAYSYVCVGGLAAQQALHEPVEATLFFAGEAVDVSGHVGTVHGALASGLLASERIVW